MTRPLVQVWNSLVQPGPLDELHRAALHRAQRAWQGEDRIWLIPEATTVTRWSTEVEGLMMRDVIVPSETFDCISVFNVDQRGRVFPLIEMPPEWNRQLPEGLYRHWLNAQALLLPIKGGIRIDVPVTVAGRVEPGTRRISLAGKVRMPYVALDKGRHVAFAVWPPPGSGVVPPVSPEAEARMLSAGTAPDQHFPEIRPLWLEPFDRFLPLGGGADLLYHHNALLRDQVRAVSEGRRAAALTEAETWVGHLVSKAQASWLRAVFAPAALLRDKGVLTDASARYGIDVDGFDQAFGSEELQKRMTEQIPVTRVQGWLGYFWWEFYNDVATAHTIRFCEHCGASIRGGHRDRRYCRASENRVCFRETESARQRRRRADESASR